MIVGLHTQAQVAPLRDLMPLWKMADDLGFQWISTSDHLPGGLGRTSTEAIATHMAIASCTSRATVGVLVYSVGLRHPALIAAAATTIDHYSGGRAAVGLGAGAVQDDHKTYGFQFPNLGRRMEMLEEAVQCVRALFQSDAVDFTGDFFKVSKIEGHEKPLQARLPIVIGTVGERRGLRIAAQYADGWNSALVTVSEFERKRIALLRHCHEIQRNPSEIRCSSNLLFAPDREKTDIPERARDSALTGSMDEIVDRMREYEARGADQINLIPVYPWDREAIREIARVLDLDSIASD